MYSKVITKNKGKEPFPTQKIRAKSFARELKSLLLPDQESIDIEKPEYNKQIDALNSLMIKVGADFSYKNKGGLKISPDFISKSRLSDWWNGKAIPSPAKQLDIEKAFPNLATKWFDRCSFSNRFQLHLASLDLNYIDSKDSNYASNEAWSILNKIISDWKPKGQNSSRLEISGPKNRAGYDPELELIHTVSFPASESSKQFLIESAIKEKIKYDLTLGPISYVNTIIPIFIAETYQQGNPFSIVTYMFCLLCLGDDQSNSNYKNDLFLDFLSALNYAHFFVFKQSGGMLLIENDKASTNIIRLFIHVHEYYYDDYWSSENQKERQIKWQIKRQYELEKAKANGLKFDPLFNSELMSHPAYLLANMLEDIITNEISRTSLLPEEKAEFQKILYNVPRVLINFRKFYASLYQGSGLTEKDVVESLLKKFRFYSAEDGSDITVYASGRPYKPSPYGW